MTEIIPKNLAREQIVEIVESARSDMSGRIVLPAGVLDIYVEIKIEDARKEDQATISTLNKELGITRSGYAEKVNEITLIKGQNAETLQLVLDSLTAALAKSLGSPATEQVVKKPLEEE